MSRLAARTWLGAALLTCLLTAGASYAEVKPQDAAAARELFDLGRKLASEKRYAEACPKLEESHKLDPGAGTLFHLADCYEHADRPASAWALFLDVASQSAAAGRTDRANAAKERAAALRPKLPQMTISVAPDNATDGLTVKRDGTEVGKGSWAIAVPVDPGKHAIEASAPGRKAWTSIIEIPAGPGTTEVRIPLLEATSGSAPEPATSTPVSTSDGKGRRTMGLVVGGTGILAFGASIALAAHAKSRFNETSSMCDGNACSREGVDQRDSARSEGNIATIVGGVGLAAIAAGTLLYLTAPKGAPAATANVRSKPVLALGPTGVVVRGVW